MLRSDTSLGTSYNCVVVFKTSCVQPCGTSNLAKVSGSIKESI